MATEASLKNTSSDVVVRRVDLEKQNGGVADFKAHLVIGGKGQGKSTWMRDRADEFQRKFSTRWQPPYFPRVFVHDYSNSKAFRDMVDLSVLHRAVRQRGLRVEHPLDLLRLRDKNNNSLPFLKKGMYRYFTTDEKEIQMMHQYLFRYFWNGLVILDECTAYFNSNPPQWQKEILTNHRNRGMEVIYAFHQIMTVPRFFARSDMISDITLFKTKENVNYKDLERYSCHSELWEAYQRVRKSPETNKLGQYHETIIV